MAVQAQYPSNVLFISRNGQEGDDYLLQPQPGRFLDQSHMLFNNGGISNARKRGREEIASPINHFPMNHSHPPQLIELSQLNLQRSNGVSTGLRLSFDDQQKQQEVSHSSSLLSLLSEDFASLMKQQSDEIEQFLYIQAEELQRTLAERRKKHYHALLSAAEESVTRKLTEKAAEVEKATRRNAEYESRAAQLSVEAQLWRAKAKSQETTAAALQAQLQKMMTTWSVTAGAHDRRGRGGEGDYPECAEGVAEDAESGHLDPARINIPGPKCRCCRGRAATVVLLPCRHLCVCRDCEQVVKVCPICLASRDSSVEVYLC